MPNVTYYAAVPFSRDDDGDFVAGSAVEAHGAGNAKAAAERIAGDGRERGAIAFSRTGDPGLGEWENAVILGRYGDVPDDLAPYTSG